MSSRIFGRIKILGFQQSFYWGTTKKIIVAVGSIFDNVTFMGDHGDEIRVPLYYSPREKFIENRSSNPSIESTAFNEIFPAIGFELQSLTFAPERHLNPLARIENVRADDNMIRSYNRIPYDLTFSVTVGAKRFEDSLKIMEQIIPFFTPNVNLTIRDREEFKLETNIDVVLNSVALNMTYEGSYDGQRSILWDLQLTAKSYYYTPVDSLTRIKESLIEMRSMDFDQKFETYSAEIVPRNAKPTDPHQIIEKVIPGDNDL